MMHVIMSLHSFIKQNHTKYSYETIFASFEVVSADKNIKQHINNIWV